MMRICGVECRGSEAILVFLEVGAEGEFVHIDCGTKRLALADDDSQESVRKFYAAIIALFDNNGVQHIAVRKRSKKGEFAGGPVSFKVEGLLQLMPEVTTHLIAPATVAASLRKKAAETPAKVNKYQEEAYRVALCLARQIGNG